MDEITKILEIEVVGDCHVEEISFSWITFFWPTKEKNSEETRLSVLIWAVFPDNFLKNPYKRCRKNPYRQKIPYFFSTWVSN